MKLAPLAVLGTCLIPLAACDPAAPEAAADPEPRRPIVDTQPANLKPPPPPPVTASPHFVGGNTVKLEARLGHAILPSYADTETYLFAHLTADPGAKAKDAVPLALSIVIDRSGSMKGKRLENAIAAARSAVSRLRDGDVLTIVTYNTAAETLVAPALISADSREAALDALDGLRAKGDTCISCGLDAGVKALGDRPGMISRVLLLSDGLATDGVRDVPGFRRIAEEIRRGGAAITTIGVDVDYDEKIMTALARDSNGRHYFVEDARQLPAIFDREMDSLTHTIANRAQLVVELAPGVVAEEVHDRVTTSLGSSITVPLGAFAAGEHKTVLVRIRVPRGTPGERAVATVRVELDDLSTGSPATTDGQLTAELSSDPGKLSPLDGIVAGRVASSDTAAVLQQANDLYVAGDADQADALVRAQAAKVDAMRTAASTAAPAGRAADVDSSFDVQAEALAGATSGFAAPTAPATAADPAPAPSPKRAGKAQVRSNAAEAFELGL